eukprot:TRINITY_DN54099_c0_g1_i1.p1 TRINITY_DN54099_c0_g1~~TRINITY_DN54099_c0_g1_i1.p1  ORF type:complete len:308 (+),score=71.94 TRINITY_DN54099_c0_g1_i1:66-989(+)
MSQDGRKSLLPTQKNSQRKPSAIATSAEEARIGDGAAQALRTSASGRNDDRQFDRRRKGIGQGAGLSGSALRNLVDQESSEAESSSDSSEEEADEAKETKECSAGPLLQGLTSRWKGFNEKLVVQLIKSGDVDLSERLLEPWDLGFARYRHTIGAQALHFAVRLGLMEASETLLQHKAAIDAQTDTGVSALMVAVMFHNMEAAKLLVEYKASVLLQESNGLTVLDLAMLEGDSSIASLLLRRAIKEEEELEDKVISEAVAAGADISLLPPRKEDLVALDEELIMSQLSNTQSAPSPNSPTKIKSEIF